MMVKRYPNLKEEVGGSNPGCEISSLPDRKLARWSTASCALAMACQPSISKRKEKKNEIISSCNSASLFFFLQREHDCTTVGRREQHPLPSTGRDTYSLDGHQPAVSTSWPHHPRPVDTSQCWSHSPDGVRTPSQRLLINKCRRGGLRSPSVGRALHSAPPTCVDSLRNEFQKR